jgi:hypothetical protein
MIPSADLRPPRQCVAQDGRKAIGGSLHSGSGNAIGFDGHILREMIPSLNNGTTDTADPGGGTNPIGLAPALPCLKKIAPEGRLFIPYIGKILRPCNPGNSLQIRRESSP